MNAPITPRPTRETRKPFGSQLQKLAYEARKGYHRHWFNELPGRIDMALQAGYTHVQDKDGNNVKRVVGIASDGGPLVAHLMETPEEWYQEDMRQQQARVDESDKAIRSGSVAGEPGQDGRYIKNIDVKTGGRT